MSKTLTTEAHTHYIGHSAYVPAQVASELERDLRDCVEYLKNCMGTVGLFPSEFEKAKALIEKWGDQ